MTEVNRPPRLLQLGLMMPRGDRRGAKSLRVLALMQLASSLADGLLSGVLALYLVAVRDVGVGRAALLLTVAEGCGMGGAAVLGWASDMLGRRETIFVSYGSSALACAILGLGALDFGGLVLAASAVAFAMRGAASVRNAVIADEGGADRVRTRAYLRTVMNGGLLAGLGAAALVAASHVELLYRASFVAAATCYAVGAAVSSRLPRDLPAVGGEKPRGGAVRRGRPGTPVWRRGTYLLTMAALACFVVNFEVLGLGMSLWLVGVHHAPAWLVPTALTVNSLLAILVQLPLSAGVDSVPAAVSAIGRALVWVTLGSLMLAVAPYVGSWLAALVIAAAGIHTIGDVLGSAGQWGLEMELADPWRQGEYQGAASLLAGAARSLAPQLVVLFLLRYDSWGWFGLVAFFALAALTLRWSALRMWSRSSPEAVDPAVG